MDHNISDYDKFGYDYEKYWKDESVNREYENIVEGIAIKKLLPKEKTWICDLGGGFGRLYPNYGDVFASSIVADYSLENLKKARESIKDQSAYMIALNAYHLPFRKSVLDCILSVRLMHHLENAPDAMKEISRVIVPEGSLVLEYANKRHFFEILKVLIGKSKMKPFSIEPTKRGELFYNFHPKYIRGLLKENDLMLKKEVSVSNLRHQIFKKTLGVGLMVIIDRIFGPLFSAMKFGPSIFTLSTKKYQEGFKPKIDTNIKDILACPKCQSDDLEFTEKKVHCPTCGKSYPIIDGIYDFRV